MRNGTRPQTIKNGRTPVLLLQAIKVLKQEMTSVIQEMTSMKQKITTMKQELRMK